MFGRIVDYHVKNQCVEIEFEKVKGCIEIISESIVNVFAGLETEEHRSNAIENLKKQQVSYEVEKEDECIAIKTPKLTVKVYDEFKIDFYDCNGKALCRDYRGTRKSSTQISNEFLELIAKEGHEIASQTGDHKIQIVKKMDGDETFYGLGDKTGFLNKRHYFYEMWNTDNPAPQVDNFKALYKSLPFFITLKKDSVYGIFFDNTYHSYFDMGKENDDYFYFGCDNGNLDYYFIAGDRMTDVVTGYTYLTGTTHVPQLWTLGYQQSRWGYRSEQEIRHLAKKFREYHIPCDTIHLDIDYMDSYKVFTWNKETYDEPKKMIEDLRQDGFKIVTIIDPGVKVEKDYFIYDKGVENGYFVTTPEGEIYVNTVWPGDAVYPDFGNPEVRSWWGDNQKYLLDMGVRGVWNDMNEPASFRGELPADLIFHDEDKESTHDKMHNLYGHLMAKATYEGLKKHDKKRPYVITRACFCGSQKYTTAWTGDNHSIWAHLQMAIPQLCNLGLSGMSYVGSDIGGFGSDTTPELLARRVQIGCFSPLFRNHSAVGTTYQEPWQFGEEIMDIYRKYVQIRYRLLPYFYDLFFEGESTGLPIMRPLILHYEKDQNAKNINDEFLIGEHILVAPVVNQGDTQKLVYLPKGIWVDYWTKEVKKGGNYYVKEAALDTCPIYVKAGSILPNYLQQEYVGEKTINDLILDVYRGEGTYHHYQDDGESFDYQNGKYNEYLFTINNNGDFTAEFVHKGFEKTYKGFEIHYNNKKVYITFDGEKVKVPLRFG